MQKQVYLQKNMDAVQASFDEMGINIPLSDDFSVFKKQLRIGHKNLNNPFVINPMEGFDGKLDGSPDEYTHRRYQRFAKSGAALIWFEAVAVEHEGRSNVRQLFINKGNVDNYKVLVSQTKELCLKENGFEPVIIMQATHSGRYSKPNGTPEPIIAYNNPLFEKNNTIPKDRIISDSDLRRLEERFLEATILSQKAGFDGIDIKSCHRYLSSELLSAFQRAGVYGGSFENRTRFLTNCIRAAKSVTKDFIVTTRLNIYDGFEYPYGFGVKEGCKTTPDYTEPIKLIGILKNTLGIELINITMGNPYVNPFVNRPFDNTNAAEQEPIINLARMVNGTGEIQKKYRDLKVVCSGLSYLRQYSANVAAGILKKNMASLVGFGREAFAYPTFASDILKNGSMKSENCCITCGKCSELMRAGSVTGCVIRDKDPYLGIYQKNVK